MEKFLGGRAEDLRGRRVSEIFAAGHPLRAALRIEGDHIESVEGAEVTLERGAGQLRIGVSAQVIREHGKRMGALVTLHDIETLERIGNQLQVSERLAALGRVTAGVAHEVKNPLNSMRLWLEVLKANMPIDPEPQQAVKMLDSEIDRLDRAVKTFLNFTKPVEINLEETDLRALIEEVLDAARPSITKAGLELKVDAPENFPPVLLDRQLIHQCLLNLLLNASQLHSPGRPHHRRPGTERRVCGHRRFRHGKGHIPRRSRQNISAILHHAARGDRHRIGKHVPVCAAAQWPHRI